MLYLAVVFISKLLQAQTIEEDLAFFKRRRNDLENTASLPLQERVYTIGRIIVSMGPPVEHTLPDEGDALYQEALQRMYETEDYAQLLVGRIEEPADKAYRYLEYEAGTLVPTKREAELMEDGVEPFDALGSGVRISGHMTSRMNTIQIINHLKTVEMVKAMLGLLDDTRQLYDNEKVVLGSGGDIGNSMEAKNWFARVLTDSPELSVPGEDFWDYTAPLHQEWLTWRDEVRNGKMTFQFKGFNQHYNINGPVESRSRNLAGARSESSSNGHLSGEDITGSESSQNSSNQGVRTSIWLALLALIGAISYWGYSRMRVKT